MRKNVALVLASALVVAGAAACSSSSNNGTGGTTASSSSGTTTTTTTTTSSTTTSTTTSSTTSSTGGAGGGGGAGPGDAIKCPSSGKNAYETYGLAGFEAVNESIFTNVENELTANGSTNLGTSLMAIGSGNPPSTMDSLATFKGKLAAFLVWAYGGPASITYTDGKTYVGPQDMVTEHTGQMITMSQYNYFITNIALPALESNGVSAKDAAGCFAPVVTNPTFVASIVGH